MNRLTTLAAAVFLFNSAVLCAQESRGLVYDFSATWCGPCQQVAPIVEKLEREGLPIQSVDIDKQRDLANKFGIQQIPTFVLVIDGKEVDRTTGRMTEADLRRMIARIPKKKPQVASTAAPSADGLSMPVELGETAPLVRPEPARTSEAPARVAQADSKKKLRDYIPFGRKKTEAKPAVVRGNDSSVNPSAASVAPASGKQADPMESSVRLRVVTNGRIDLGSGTVISSKAGFTQILTCAHIFKDFTDDSKIEVDVFERGGVTPYIARLVKFDKESDLGLISIPTDHPVAQTPVGGPNSVPNVGETVAAIGCSGGDEPTQQQSRVTDIDKYEGPHNLLCTGVPVRGRSGGGLFNQAGEIIGVCSAADEQEQRGFYSGLLAIHKLLDDCNLTELYRPAAPSNTDPVEGMTATEPANDRSFPEVASREVPKAAPATAPASVTSQTDNAANAAMDVQAGDAEVVVIIRDRSQPQAANRVVILHQASPKFMSYLSGELTEGEMNMDMLGRATTSTSIPAIQREPRQSRTPALASKGKSVDQSKSGLQQTTLSQPVVPKRYIRRR